MDARLVYEKTTRSLVVAAALCGVVVLVMGCDEPSAQAEPKVSAEPKASAEPKPADGVEKAGANPGANAEGSLGQAAYKEAAFHVSLEAPKAVKAGVSAEFKVVLEAQGGYKVNEEYPLKFQFAESSAVLPAKSTVRKEDGKVETKRAEIPLSVIIKTPGKHKISGKLSFSVCTDERCLIEKRDLSLEVDAS